MLRFLDDIKKEKIRKEEEAKSHTQTVFCVINLLYQSIASSASQHTTKQNKKNNKMFQEA